ncbi:MAG TPA: ATP-dependent helicase, partial [Steroidobacteraceae bacterium]|nr:ATP-dependent helicase [Steroidobacteraceae bacterium]
NYTLSVTQRCGTRIMEWASYVIEGDPDRVHGRPRLQSAEGSPPGEVALLAFRGNASEANGVADLVQHLINDAHVEANEILILLRGDHNGAFSSPIKAALEERDIGYSDPEIVNQLLAEPANRRMLATFRLLVNPRDSLAWATLLHLTPRIGQTFPNYIYERARTGRVQFGQALLDAYDHDFVDGPRPSSTLATALIGRVNAWLREHRVPDETPEQGWGHWMVETAGGDVVPAPSAPLTELLYALDELIESERDLGQYLSQITPLGKDHARAQSQGVRIMTMAGAKGLTVRAAIIVGLEQGIVPRPGADLQEERRLLYVAMTRAKEYLFGTWARRRQGPTARAGAARVADRRELTNFLRGGPVASQDGQEFLERFGVR